MHGGALVCAWVAPLPLFVRASLAIAIAFSAHRAIGLHGLRTAPDAIMAIKESGERRYTRLRADKDWQRCEIQVLFVHPALVLVRVVRSRGRMTLVIAADAVNRDVFRDWRRHLVWTRSQPATGRLDDIE